MSIRGLAGNNKGVTLIELLIAVALTGMIMSLGYGMYFFGTGSFERGTAQAQAQHNARLADQYLKAELRNALKIEIGEAGREGDFHGYFHLAEGSLIKSGERVTGNTLIDLAVRIIKEGNRAILEYRITSSDHNEEFVFTNRILLNNISAAAFDASYGALRSLDLHNNGYVLYYDLAEVVERYNLTMAVSPAGTGTTTPPAGSYQYATGSTVNINAVANAGFRFSHWTAPAGTFGNATAAQTTFTMPAQNVTVTANFVPEVAPRFALTMAVSPAGSGTATDLTAGSPYAAGTAVNIRAVANAGHAFSHWSVTPAGAGTFVNVNAAQTTFTMPAQNVTVTANFVTVILWPDAGGFIYNLGLHAGEWDPGFQEGGGSQSKQEHQLYLLASQGSGRAERTYVTRQSVNLTNVREIRIEWENTGANFTHNQSYLIVSASQTGAHSTFNRRLSVSRPFIRRTDTLSVNLSGDFFIRVHAREDHSSQDRRSELRVYRIWLIYR